MNSIIRLKIIVLTLFLFICLLPGCGANNSTQKQKGTPHIAIYFLGSDTSKLDSDEVEPFNEMTNEMIQKLINDINEWGFETSLLKTQVGTFNYDNKGYMLRFSLTPHRLVSDTTQSMIGIVAGPNIVEDHFEFIDLKSKKMITWGKYTRDSELAMETILQRKVDDAIFKIDSFINNQ